MKQLCVYGETEKIRKYIVGEGIHKYALGKERKSSVMFKCVIYVSVCVFFPPALSTEIPRANVTQ